MKKFLSLVLVLVLAFASMNLAAFADESAKYIPVKRVTIRCPVASKTVRVDKTLTLEERIYPEDVPYESIEWSSSDDDIVYVYDDGECEGVSPGTATITCKVKYYNEKGTKLLSAYGYIDITVPGKAVNNNNSLDDNEDSKSSNSTSSTGTVAATGGDKIATSTVTAKVREVAKKNKTTYATFKDAGSVSASTLQSAAQVAKSMGATVMLNFDTMDGKKVEGRLVINPANAANLKNDIKLGVYTNEKATIKVLNIFNKYYTNNVVVIKASQSGQYGMYVSYAVKASSALAKSKNLKLYSYKAATNSFVEVKNADIKIDANNYAHFKTNLGDYLVLSDGALARKGK